MDSLRDRVRKFRKNLQISNASDEKSYNSYEAERKALSRARKGLPKNEKRRTIVEKLKQQYSPLSNSALKKKAIARPTKQLCPNVRNAVVEFFNRIDISSQAPGRKGFVTISDDDGNKTKVQTKYPLYPIHRIYEKCCEEFGSVPIKPTKFYELRPKNILPVGDTPANLCLCMYHADFINAVDSIKKVIPEMPAYGEEFYSSFFCEPMSKACWINECPDCNGVFYDTLRGTTKDQWNVPAKWNQWLKNPRWINEVRTATLGDLVERLFDIAPNFFVHNYAKREQQKSFLELIEISKTNQKLCVVQTDFAENYTCVSQVEVANAHWGQGQVTVFTAAIWSTLVSSYAVTSDNTIHAKETIVPYLDHLFEKLPKAAETVHLFTDGPSSQFKNKYMAVAQAVLQEKYQIKLYWNFFPTSHGKGAVDGIGGSLKRQVWSSVKSRESTVSNATEFTSAIVGHSKVNVVHTDQNEIESRLSALDLVEKWKRAPEVRGISNFHHIQIHNGKAHGFLTTSEGITSLKNL